MQEDSGGLEERLIVIDQRRYLAVRVDGEVSRRSVLLFLPIDFDVIIGHVQFLERP